MLETSGNQEAGFDLMRCHQQAPSGIMEFLMIELIMLKQQQGCQQVNLGLVPLSSHGDDLLKSLLNRVATFMYQSTNMTMGMSNDERRQWFAMYQPRWVPKYLVSLGGNRTSRILRDVARLSFPKTTQLRSDLDETLQNL
ncbi:MAG TPA: DUF2156 domain-containing protein [Crenotrichaceae bacterium]|nr:DUF2156 domain-containing protein [Crenotrichaceae bacterium]